MSSETTTTRKRKSRSRTEGSVGETLTKWRECQSQLDSCNVEAKRIRRIQAIGSKKGCMKGKGGPENSQCKYRGVRQRTWGKWVVEIREPNGGKRLWLGTFSNAKEAALTYDEAARTMYGSRARLNFPDSSSASTSSSICPTSIETPPEFYSTTTSNYSSEVFAVGDEDRESVAFAYNEDATATFAVEDIMHVSPNEKNEDGEGELRADTQHSVVAETNMPNTMIEEPLTGHFMDEMFDLDDVPELFDDDLFSNIELPWDLDFDVGQLGFLDVDQCGNP